MIPTIKEFHDLEKHMGDCLFNFVLAGRCRATVRVTSLRYFHEVDPEQREGWMIHIHGLDPNSQIELDTISVFLMEQHYDVNNIEIFLESDE
jgi:hypothetical protein